MQFRADKHAHPNAAGAACYVSVYDRVCKGNNTLSENYNKTQWNNENFIFSNDMVCERIGTILNC